MVHELNEHEDGRLYRVGWGTNVAPVWRLHDVRKGTHVRKGKKRKRSGGFVHTTINGQGCIAQLRKKK